MSRIGEDNQPQLALHSQLRWFIRLRWIAAAAVVAAASLDWAWMGIYRHHVGMVVVGACIAVYNLLLRGLTSRVLRRKAMLTSLAWLQILLDMACLTLLTLWTGGVGSPLLGFYVFHMVFASLLLNRTAAYGAAAAAWGMLSLGLALTGRWPTSQPDGLVLAGWGVMLLLTVYLANRITGSLRRQQQALAHQEQMAAIGQLAAGVAHEVANPLACMDSMLQLAQRKGAGVEAQAIVPLREQIQRIEKIVRGLTHFAHPDQSDWQEVLLDETVDRTMQLLRFDRRMRRVKLEEDRQAAGVRVYGQPLALQQVLMNLVINALDATAEVAEPRLTLRTGIGVSAGVRECFIEVGDNGPGIAPEHIGRLFEPFFTTKPAGKGTGLGLSISDSLVRSHGGRIEVASDGRGARFRVCLPIAKAVS